MPIEHGLRMLFAYAVASLIVVIIFFVVVDGSRVFLHPEIVVMTIVYSALVAMIASPISALFLFFAERKRICSVIPFAVAGLFAGLFALSLDNTLLGRPSADEMDMMNATVLFAGVTRGEFRVDLIYLVLGTIGGLAYWAVAGRYSGKWKSAQ